MFFKKKTKKPYQSAMRPIATCVYYSMEGHYEDYKVTFIPKDWDYKKIAAFFGWWNSDVCHTKGESHATVRRYLV